MPEHVLLSACHNNVHADRGPQNIQTRQELLGNMSSGSLSQLCALLAIPFAFRPIFRRQPHALKVKPLNGTVLVVTSNHLTKRNTLTVTVDRLTRVYSCWNGICCACIANKRSSQMTKMYSGVRIAPLQPATVLLLGNTCMHSPRANFTPSSLGMSRTKECIAGDCCNSTQTPLAQTTSLGRCKADVVLMSRWQQCLTKSPSMS